MCLLAPLRRNWRSIIPTVESWRPVRGNVMAMLTIHAYCQLLVAYSRIGGLRLAWCLSDRCLADRGEQMLFDRTL